MDVHMLNRNPYEDEAEMAGDLSSPGPRRLRTVIIWGVIIPVVIAYFATKAWTTRSAVLWGDDGEDVKFAGDAARAMAVAYGGVAVFLNGRSCWGALGFYRTHQVMSVLGCLAFVGGVFGALVWGFAGA